MISTARRGAVLLTALGVLALSGCSFPVTTDPVRDEESGEIVESNDAADVFSLQVGDCFDGSELSGEISTVPVVPCADPHEDEVYASYQLTDAGAFPGDDAVFEEASGLCIDGFASFVGIAYESSALEVWPMYPSEQSWAAGDREALCMVYDPEGTVTGSLEGAAR